MDGYGYVNDDDDDDYDDDDGDDDDDEIAPDAKVSFFSVLWSPLKNVWKVTTAGAGSDARHHVHVFGVRAHVQTFVIFMVNPPYILLVELPFFMVKNAIHQE